MVLCDNQQNEQLEDDYMARRMIELGYENPIDITNDLEETEE